MSSIAITREITSVDDIEFELIRDGKLKEGDDNHYVNNKEFYEELQRYHQHKMECLEKGLDVPPLTDKIGSAILQIATRRCNSRMYRGYTESWKQEMISNAVVSATLRGHNFDPSKSDNPFAYFTQVCDNAIKEQLKREKLQLYIRYKSIDEMGSYQATQDTNDNDLHQHEEMLDVGYDDRLKFINDYEERAVERRKRYDQAATKEEDLGVLRLDFVD